MEMDKKQNTQDLELDDILNEFHHVPGTTGELPEIDTEGLDKELASQMEKLDQLLDQAQEKLDGIQIREKEILTQANAQAEKILEQARKEADRIRAEADRQWKEREREYAWIADLMGSSEET